MDQLSWSAEEARQVSGALEELAIQFGENVGPERIAIYIKRLSKYPAPAILAAIDRIGETADRFPSANQIREAISGKPEDQAEHAWQIVMEALARIGTYQSIEFRDPIINAVLRELVGTWADMRKHDDGENGLVWLGRDFKKLYCDYLRKGMVPEVGHLPGATELDNKRRGLYDAIKEPVAFGPGPQAPIKKLAPPKDKPLPSGKVRALTEKVKGVA